MGRTCTQVCVCVFTCVFVYFLGRLFRLFTADKSALLFIKKKNVPAAVCLLSAYKAGRRQQPEGLHWSPLWKWRCESLTEIVCSQLLALYATGADALAVCQLLTPLMLSVCIPHFPLSAFQIVHSPALPLSEMLNCMLTQLSCQPVTRQQEVGFVCDDAVTVIFRIYLCVLPQRV